MFNLLRKGIGKFMSIYLKIYLIVIKNMWKVLLNLLHKIKVIINNKIKNDLFDRNLSFIIC
jgi:hypothetical protein